MPLPRTPAARAHHDAVVDEALPVPGGLQVRVLLRAGHLDAPGKQFRLANARAATDRRAMVPGCRTHDPEGRTPCQPLTLPPADRPASPPDTVTTHSSVGGPDYGDDLHGG